MVQKNFFSIAFTFGVMVDQLNNVKMDSDFDSKLIKWKIQKYKQIDFNR